MNKVGLDWLSYPELTNFLSFENLSQWQTEDKMGNENRIYYIQYTLRQYDQFDNFGLIYD